LPGKLSRTSTHAIAVPAIAFTRTTISDEIRVSSSADLASGVVTCVQKASSPSANPFEATAAIGMRTITLR
jgi:hypothetical protein